jgi:hypothetical protein
MGKEEKRGCDKRSPLKQQQRRDSEEEKVVKWKDVSIDDFLDCSCSKEDGKYKNDEDARRKNLKKVSDEDEKDKRTTPKDKEKKPDENSKESEGKLDREYREGLAKYGSEVDRVLKEGAKHMAAEIHSQNQRKAPTTGALRRCVRRYGLWGQKPRR